MDLCLLNENKRGLGRLRGRGEEVKSEGGVEVERISFYFFFIASIQAR